MEQNIIIRTAKIEDAQALLDIYTWYVTDTAITFEYEVPTLEEFQKRIGHILEKYPYLVAQTQDGQIVGYAYADRYRPRAAFAWDAELSIYLDHNRRGHGVGKKLYHLLEEILKEQGVVNAIALITPPRTDDDKETYNSIHFHEEMGYENAGKIIGCGYKFGQWFDLVTMVKQIGHPSEHMEEIKKYDEVREQFAEIQG